MPKKKKTLDPNEPVKATFVIMYRYELEGIRSSVSDDIERLKATYFDSYHKGWLRTSHYFIDTNKHTEELKDKEWITKT